MVVVSTLVELIRPSCKSECAKDLEILLSRRQLTVYDRTQELRWLLPPSSTSSEEKYSQLRAQDVQTRIGCAIDSALDLMEKQKPATQI
jgi:hypothetical protein